MFDLLMHLAVCLAGANEYLTDGLIEIAKLLGAMSIAVMSMSVVTYALAVPRLQAALSASLKQNREDRAKLKRRIDEKSVTLEEIEDQLKVIEREQNEMRRVLTRLSWNRVVVVPAGLASLGLGFVATMIAFSSAYDFTLLVISMVLLSLAFLHLLQSLSLIEQAAVRPGVSVEV